MDARSAKRALRAQIRASRRNRSADDARRAAQALATVGSAHSLMTAAKVVAAYAPLPGEPDVGPLIDRLRQAGTQVLLPRIVSAPDGAPGLEFARLDDALHHLAPGQASPWGVRVPEPAGPVVDLSSADVVLVPALAADSLGARLGQGGGYYDRALARLGSGVPAYGAPGTPGPSFVGVVFDDEFLPPGTIPTEPHDASLHAVLTPSGWHTLPA